MESFLSQHGLSLIGNEHKFRSIISNKTFITGSTIIISHPLTSFPISKNKLFKCDQCLKTNHSSTPLQTCSKCQKIYYCGKSCQQSSWKSHHKLLCPLYVKSKSSPSSLTSSTDDEDDDIMDEEMLKRVAILIDKFLNNEILDSNKNYLFETFLKLMTHKMDQSNINLKKFEKISNKVYENLNFNKINKIDLINYLCIFYCNNFIIHDNQLFTCGEGTYPIGSLLNHSCRPNAIIMYDGAVQIIKCIEDINIGEEINISYVDVALDREARQKMLQERYFFKCQCPRCFDEEKNSGMLFKIDQLIEEKDQEIMKQDDFNTTVISTLEQKESKFSDIITLILSTLLPHLKNNTTTEDYVRSLSKIISTLFQQNYDSTTKFFHTSSLSFTTKLFYDKIDLKQWNQSTILGKYIFSIYLMIYPRYHPIIGLHLFTLGKCYWNDITNGLESIKESINILECAKKVLKITHNESGNENNDVISQVNDLLNTAKRELSNSLN